MNFISKDFKEFIFQLKFSIPCRCKTLFSLNKTTQSTSPEILSKKTKKYCWNRDGKREAQLCVCVCSTTTTFDYSKKCENKGSCFLQNSDGVHSEGVLCVCVNVRVGGENFDPK